MSDKPKKFIFVDGVMKRNPAYDAYQNAANPSSPSAASNNASHQNSSMGDNQSLAVVSSLDDIMNATELYASSTGAPMQVAPSTASAMESLQDSSYTNQFHSNVEIDGCELLDELTDYFVQFEVPVGMINKVVALKDYRLSFIIDDSGSMRAPTDVYLTEGTPHVLRGTVPTPGVKMTRWQEAENRMHILIDIISFIPTKPIVITFMNAPEVIHLQHDGQSIEAFRADAHAKIIAAFSANAVRYKTPTYACLSKSFADAATHPEPTMHYLITDGQPSDKPIEMVADLIQHRRNPAANPVTLLSCSDEDSEVEWMKVIEEKAPFCSELDDYVAEKAEVIADQGTAFPFTKGMWIISMLVGAINPHDLDAMDENLPFTRATLDDILGRCHTPEEYKYYFDRNAHAALYRDMFSRFLNEKVHARALVTEAEQRGREMRAGYVDGKPPGGGLATFPAANHQQYQPSQGMSVPPASSLPMPPTGRPPPSNPQYRPTPTYNNSDPPPPPYGS